MYRPILETFGAWAADRDPEWLFPLEGRTWRASELLARSRAAAAVLAQRGVGPGTLVGLSMENQSGFVIAALATWRLGAALVPLRPLRGSAEDVLGFLERIERCSPLAVLLFDDHCDVASIYRWSESTGRSALYVVSLAALRPEQAHEPAALAPAPPDALALVQYSSGSTGEPKGVIVTHRMLIEQADQIADSYRAGTGKPLHSIATWVPLYHDAGLFTGLILPLVLGCRSLIATPRYFVATPVRWFRLVSEREVDLLVATNAAMVLALRQLEKQAVGALQLPGLHLFISAEKVSAEVLRRTLAWLGSCGAGPSQLHVPFGLSENTLSATCAYGQAPATGWFSIGELGEITPEAGPLPGAIELVSCGPAYPGVSLRICAGDGTSLPELRLGELTISGPCVTPGYLNDPEATRHALRGNHLHTADLGFLHRGEFWYVARKDDKIVVDGRNIVPDDVEQTAESLGFLRPGSTALVALEHAGGQQLCLLVEDVAHTTSADRADRRRALRERVMRAHDLLLCVRFCARGSVEKTSSGKKRRKLIRQRLAEHRLQLYSEDRATLPAAPRGED